MAELDAGIVPELGLLVPVRINTQPELLLLDTGSVVSALFGGTAAQLHLTSHQISGDRFMNVAGQPIRSYVSVESLRVGMLDFGKKDLLLWPDSPGRVGQPAGLLGPDLLQRVDVEIDPAAHKVRFFSPDHCPGKVLYWANADVEVPLRVAHSGHLYLKMTLDGHELDALIDTGSPHSLLSLTTARHLYDLTPDSPGIEPYPIDGSGLKRYRYPFKSLSIQGLQVSNPSIDIIQDRIYRAPDRWEMEVPQLHNDEETRLPDLILGMGIISKLHLYIAYGEQRLYLTAADAK